MAATSPARRRAQGFEFHFFYGIPQFPSHISFFIIIILFFQIFFAARLKCSNTDFTFMLHFGSVGGDKIQGIGLSKGWA